MLPLLRLVLLGISSQKFHHILGDRGEDKLLLQFSVTVKTDTANPLTLKCIKMQRGVFFFKKHVSHNYKCLLNKYMFYFKVDIVETSAGR